MLKLQFQDVQCNIPILPRISKQNKLEEMEEEGGEKKL